MSNALMKKFDQPSSNSEGGMLATLWKKYMVENRLRSSLGVLINNYLKKESKKGSSSDYKTKQRSVISANATASELSWKNFIDVMMNLGTAEEMVLNMRVDRGRGRISLHSIRVFKNDNGDIEFEDLEGEGNGKKS
jgi:hypothetical protein